LAPENASAILCVGVVHLYSGQGAPVVALRNVDLEVEGGEMLGIVGPSGSGKSTLLSLLGGLLRPTAGKVLVAGHDMGRVDHRTLDRLRATELSILLQDPLRNLVPYATGAENIAFAQHGARRRHWKIRWSTDEVIGELALEQLAHTPVYRLSAGEQQKVAMAAAIATSPSVLLADEPTNQLDRTSRDAVIATLRNIHQLSGATIVVVTHDLEVAQTLPRSLSISEGAINAEARQGRSFSVVAGNGLLHLPAEVLALYPPGTLFRVLVRDEVVELHAEGEPGR
jgi:ABC-type lipoprotein export system ATPase subunit